MRPRLSRVGALAVTLGPKGKEKSCGGGLDLLLRRKSI
jgi:hypothetical protein